MKLWKKDADLDEEVEQFTVGDDPLLDANLVKYDCIASMAHARVLCKASVLTESEARKLCSELERVIALNEIEGFPIRRSDEDVHTALENHLVEALGDLGKKIHTARSRNDQVVTALRLYAKDRLSGTAALAEDLAGAMQDKIANTGPVVLPGYTHSRKAMPSSFALWMGAFVESLEDDRRLLMAVFDLIDQNPLGTGAGYGIPLFEIDREQSARELGFKKVQNNPAYVQNSRGKFEALMVSSLVNVMMDLNRMATDIILFSTREYGYFTLPEEFCTGSSIMPQKRNPDVLEVMRARYHEVLAHEFKIKSLVSGLQSGYHRDLQLTKKSLMESFDLTAGNLRMMKRVVEKLGVNRDVCEAACTRELYATEEAYKLVKQGVPFRDAYRQVAEELFRE
jgi:argininosuccinate lyase